ncbi:LacI family DNA-binding transcriptional regulator [Orbus mooreae]|uniref:LacI family DNA-binding transcriptional regulator n=1 Tax=Orbus mooreae TaxID=3074107 RepID=UPI00370D3B05
MLETKKRRNTGQITLSDVAKLAGVGTMTVSRALRTPEQVSDKLRKKIESAVNTLGYKPNIAASLLASASANNLIVIVINRIFDNGSKIILDALQSRLTEQGYVTLIIESLHYYGREEQLLESIYNNNLAAIVLFYLEKNSPISRLINNKHIPTLHIGHEIKESSQTNITVDNMLAMSILTEHVIKKGYRHIGLLCGNHEHLIFQQRLHGWHKTMLAHHLPTHRVINAAKPANFTTGSQLLADFILNWPEIDALICTTDELACGVLYECQRRHIRVPYQLAVTGFGDSEFSQVSTPPLTTISLPYQQMGENAAVALLEQLKVETTKDKITLLSPMIKARASL